jgi:uncharacterized protein YbjT (DUF2867 family)
MARSRTLPLNGAITSFVVLLLLMGVFFFFDTADAFFVSSGSRSATTTTTTSLQAIKKVFVAGGSKGVGRCIVEKLAAQGKQVVALVRRPDICAELNLLPGVTAIIGDAFIIKDVENAMDGCDAAITTLGGSTNDAGDKRVDYVGNNHVIESAGILGVTRVVLVTSIGCGNSKDAAPPNVFAVLKDVLAAKERAENVLIKYYTNTNWTIIRPGGLKSEPATGKAILTQDHTVIGAIHREDVADLVVRALDNTGTYQKIFSAIDQTVSSPSTEVEGLDKPIEAFAL